MSVYILIIIVSGFLQFFFGQRDSYSFQKKIKELQRSTDSTKNVTTWAKMGYQSSENSTHARLAQSDRHLTREENGLLSSDL